MAIAIICRNRSQFLNVYHYYRRLLPCKRNRNVVSVVVNLYVLVGSNVEAVSVFVYSVFADVQNRSSSGSGLINSIKMPCFHSVVHLDETARCLMQDRPRDIWHLFVSY